MSPRTPIVDPSGYYRRDDRPSLGFAAGLVTLEAVLTSVLTWWFVSRVLAQIEFTDAERQAVNSELSGLYFFIFLGIFFGWLLLAAIFHAFMWFADAEQGFGATLAVVGESSIVSIVMMPLVVFGFVLLLGRVPSEPNAALEFIQQVNNRRTGVLLIVGLLRVLWVGVVQAVGLSEIHDITLGKTLLVTVGLGFLFFLIG